jgi:LAO/AO transport system kinase
MTTNYSAQYFINGILQGDIAILSRAITLVESTNQMNQNLAQEIINGIIFKTGNSFRIGVTGVPGVGKSTFIESFGKEVIANGHKLAVLAIDPSSNKSKGSILGDKTRMEELSTNPNVYIRPSPSSGNLGGVTRVTYETILLCEAAGFDFIIVETVGVGQSEVAVSKVTDFFLLLMLAGAGDELQGIKRGIMEMADALIISKADGDNLNKAKAAKLEYAHAMHHFQKSQSGWIPRADICSSISNLGIKSVYKMIMEYRQFVLSTDYFLVNRKQQQFELFSSSMEDHLKNYFYSSTFIQKKIKEFQLLNNTDSIQPFLLAKNIVDGFFKNNEIE